MLLLLVVAGVMPESEACGEACAGTPVDFSEIFALMDQYHGDGDGDGPVYPREILRLAVTLLNDLTGQGGGVWSGVQGASERKCHMPGYLRYLPGSCGQVPAHERCSAGEKQELLLEEEAVMAS